MKFLFTFLSFLSLFSFILANPVPQGQGSASNQEPRTCKITADGARHRKCPEVNDTKCPATGSYAKGTMIKFMCYVVGETVKGNPYWDKTSKGEYVSETLVEESCRSKLPEC
ncbi:hypothetical protein P167DRAFT_433920 [Morchella conica CCBAS932]|uniref:Ig-like domain-containing protein n=1 Tax=Morchella conica CCBAS932 TaxID=1392247 RepID=A0A3N4KY72_9PEZI|nr:hypothetical protein P167DRAFT_433920 [Morchella conica CCBAS932]